MVKVGEAVAWESEMGASKGETEVGGGVNHAGARWKEREGESLC